MLPLFIAIQIPLLVEELTTDQFSGSVSDCSVNRNQQFFFVNRLTEKGYSSGPECRRPDIFKVDSRQENNRQANIFAGQVILKVESTHPLQPDIKYQARNTFAIGRPQELLRRSESAGLAPGRSK
jgi:hypothetical protein